MSEEWLEIIELVWTPTFIPVAVAVLLTATVGAGWWHTRWRRTVWIVSVVTLGTALYIGVGRHEWGEVLFNGQLL